MHKLEQDAYNSGNLRICQLWKTKGIENLLREFIIRFLKLPKTSSWMENCTKLGQLILSKIIKIVATSCQISRLKCTKFDFGLGSAADPAGGVYSTPPSP